jgi:hypothetical protein
MYPKIIEDLQIDFVESIIIYSSVFVSRILPRGVNVLSKEEYGIDCSEFLLWDFKSIVEGGMGS